MTGWHKASRRTAKRTAEQNQNTKKTALYQKVAQREAEEDFTRDLFDEQDLAVNQDHRSGSGLCTTAFGGALSASALILSKLEAQHSRSAFQQAGKAAAGEEKLNLWEGKLTAGKMKGQPATSKAARKASSKSGGSENTQVSALLKSSEQLEKAIQKPIEGKKRMSKAERKRLKKQAANGV